MMHRMVHYFTPVLLMVTCFFAGSLVGQEKQEITVTIDKIPVKISNPHFLKGEELRKEASFNEAIAEYEAVLRSDAPVSVKAEAHYRKGICYTWMGKLDEAEKVFKEIKNTYPDDGETVAYSRYCLSWVDIQRRKFYSAIERLQRTQDENLCCEEAFCSKAQFQIGRIYLSYLHNPEKAEDVFRNVLIKYPDSKITEHPYLKRIQIKGEEQ